MVEEGDRGTRIDIRSSTVEKGVELARDFLDRLVVPAVGEVGLLLQESVALWRFKNQVRVLNRAQEYCAENDISPSNVPLKVLCPLLEKASLEEEEVMQDRWAILLSNLADSEQNIRNHVFPSILGQISATEFEVLEQVYAEKLGRAQSWRAQLEEFQAARPEREAHLQQKLRDVEQEIERRKREDEGTLPHGKGSWRLFSEKRNLETQLKALGYKEKRYQYLIDLPEPIPEGVLERYELSNLVRLGVAQEVQETFAHPQTLQIPVADPAVYHREHVEVEVELHLDSENQHVLTELGERFMQACTEKRQQEPRSQAGG